MKVLFFVTGVGYGDSTREHADIEALLKRDKKTKVLVAGYDNSYSYFKDKFSTIKIHGYRIPGESMHFRVLPFIFKNTLLPFFWAFTAFGFRREIREFNPDVVVSDFEPVGIAASKVLGKKCIVVFGYDPELLKDYSKSNKLSLKCWVEAKYFNSLYDKADFVVIPTILGAKKQSILYHYVNPVLRKLPSSLKKPDVLMKKLGLRKPPVIVMLGGSDFGLKLARSLSSLAHKFNEDFIVFGAHTQLRDSKNFRHIGFSDNFLEYLKVAKCVVTLAGQKTLTECVAFGKPMLVFPIKDHVEQLLNAYSVRNIAMIGNGVGKELEPQIKKFLNALPALRNKMKKLDVKFDGADEIARVIEDLSRKPSSQRSRH